MQPGLRNGFKLAVFFGLGDYFVDGCLQFRLVFVQPDVAGRVFDKKLDFQLLGGFLAAIVGFIVGVLVAAVFVRRELGELTQL